MLRTSSRVIASRNSLWHRRFDVVRAAGMVRLSARLRSQSSEMLDRLPITSGSYDSWSRVVAIDAHGSAELREAYLTTGQGNVRFTVGKQLLDWGITDGFKVLDAINPQDFREFILDEFEQSRIGVWAATLEGVGDTVVWELFWSPDETTHDLADPGTGVYANGRALWWPSLPRPSVERVDPDRETIAARLTFQSAKWDWQLMALDGFELEPRLSLVDGVLSLRFPRRRLVGVNTRRSMGSAVLRVEAAFHLDRSFMSSASEATKSDQVITAIGLDFRAPWDLLASAQIIHDRVFEARSNLLRPPTDTITTLNLRRSMRNDRLAVEYRWYQSLTDGDGLHRVKLSWDTALGNFAVGRDTAYGDENGLFGQFDSADRVYVFYERTF